MSDDTAKDNGIWTYDGGPVGFSMGKIPLRGSEGVVTFGMVKE